MTTHAAFLRGINLGKNKRIAMADLRALGEALGFEDVRTHLQSGNLLFTSKAAEAELVAALEGGIATEFGFDIRVMVRTRAQLARLVNDDPMGADRSDGRLRHVAFLSAAPKAKELKAFDAGRYLPDEVHIQGRDAHLWYPGGVQGSKLSNAELERHLGVAATTRNWNTVTKVLELVNA